MEIVIGMPVFESVPGECVKSILGLAAEAASFGTVRPETAVHIPAYDTARNIIWKKAFGADRLLFVDADMTVPPGSYARLEEAIVNGAQAVAGFFYRKGHPFTPIWSGGDSINPEPVFALSGVHKLRASGMGLMLIDMAWIVKNMPDFEFYMDKKTDSEDVNFCKELVRHGGILMGHADVRCGHLGGRIEINDQTSQRMRELEILKCLKK